jgi:transaldolase
MNTIMKLFIDTANTEEIKAAAALGLLDGVTTNPSLLAKEIARRGRGRQEEIFAEICDIVAGPVSAEVLAADYEGMVREGREIAKIAPNVVIKCPLTEAGLRATRTFADEEIAVNVTLIFQPIQALLAAKAGAAYVSPFVGRLDDIAEPGMSMVADIVEIFSNYSFAAEVLVASVRSPIHVLDAARMGADVATIPYGVIRQLLHHPLTTIGIERFAADAKKYTG